MQKHKSRAARAQERRGHKKPKQKAEKGNQVSQSTQNIDAQKRKRDNNLDFTGSASSGELPPVLSKQGYGAKKERERDGYSVYAKMLANSASAHSNDTSTNGFDEDGGEEEHKRRLDRLMMPPPTCHTSHHLHVCNENMQVTHSAPLASFDEDTKSDIANVNKGPDFSLLEDCAGPTATPVLNAVSEFIRGLQHEQHQLDTECSRLEVEIAHTRHEAFRRATNDYEKIAQLEKLLDISLCLCQELFVAEYAFRDLLDEHATDFGFDFGGGFRELLRVVED